MTAVRKLTVDDLMALGSDVRAELIHGEVIPKSLPSLTHSLVQGDIAGWARRRFHRQASGRWPGGWWIGPEVHVIYENNEVFCHDVVGWRRDRVPVVPQGWVAIRPDWVCEVLSPNHEKRDLVDKMTVLYKAGVPHYWVLDREEKILLLFRHGPDGYVVRSVSADEVLHAEPFDAVELRMAVIFGIEDDEE